MFDLRKKVKSWLWGVYPWVYDLAVLQGLPYLELIETVVISLEERYHDKNNMLVLDACCGTGNFSKALINNFKIQSLVGIDFSKGMIKKAKKKIPLLKAINAPLLEGLKKIPDNNFDIIVLVNGFYPLEEKHEILLNLKRVLKVNGTFIMTDPKKGASLFSLIKEHFLKGSFAQKMKLPLFVFSILISLIFQFGIKYNFLTSEETKGLLIKTGLMIDEEKSAYADQNYFFVLRKGN